MDTCGHFHTLDASPQEKRPCYPSDRGGVSSGEALCVLTGITPIEIKVAETDRLYHITRDRQTRQMDREEEPKVWTHPADAVTISEQGQEKEHTIHIYTDGSKNEHGVGSGSAIYIQNKLI